MASKCEDCGRSFKSSQGLGGHRGHCKVRKARLEAESEGGNSEAFREDEVEKGEKTGSASKEGGTAASPRAGRAASESGSSRTQSQEGEPARSQAEVGAEGSVPASDGAKADERSGESDSDVSDRPPPRNEDGPISLDEFRARARRAREEGAGAQATAGAERAARAVNAGADGGVAGVVGNMAKGSVGVAELISLVCLRGLPPPLTDDEYQALQGVWADTDMELPEWAMQTLVTLAILGPRVLAHPKMGPWLRRYFVGGSKPASKRSRPAPAPAPKPESDPPPSDPPPPPPPDTAPRARNAASAMADALGVS